MPGTLPPRSIPGRSRPLCRRILSTLRLSQRYDMESVARSGARGLPSQDCLLHPDVSVRCPPEFAVRFMRAHTKTSEAIDATQRFKFDLKSNFRSISMASFLSEMRLMSHPMRNDANADDEKYRTQDTKMKHVHTVPCFFSQKLYKLPSTNLLLANSPFQPTLFANAS